MRSLSIACRSASVKNFCMNDCCALTSDSRPPAMPTRRSRAVADRLAIEPIEPGRPFTASPSEYSDSARVRMLVIASGAAVAGSSRPKMSAKPFSRFDA